MKNPLLFYALVCCTTTQGSAPARELPTAFSPLSVKEDTMKKFIKEFERLEQMRQDALKHKATAFKMVLPPPEKTPDPFPDEFFLPEDFSKNLFTPVIEPSLPTNTEVPFFATQSHLPESTPSPQEGAHNNARICVIL